MSELRPADLATFLLASGDLLPRKRARDQQADLAGMDMKRRVLDMVVARDPDPAELELCLAQIVAELGPPEGPTRAICQSVRDEWEQAADSPAFVEWLLGQALEESQRAGEPRGGRRGRRG
ncbi:MAG TPA: hypothetical protein PKD53_08995 [Chloroflexaceae bacterium]|nr:hypothetical protein [Chloroflexaceae bacterium]